MFEKCAWPFSSKQTKVLATLVLILLGIVIFFHPIFFGRSVGKTSRAGDTFAISIITCHGKCNIMIYDMNRDLKPPLIRCRLYISSTNVFLSTKYKIFVSRGPGPRYPGVEDNICLRVKGILSPGVRNTMYSWSN